jgi:hypothetical protein
MKMFIVGAASLVALSLPAHAVGSATIADAPVIKATTQQHLAQRPYDPSKQSKKKKKKIEQRPSSTGPYNPNADSAPSRKK